MCPSGKSGSRCGNSGISECLVGMKLTQSITLQMIPREMLHTKPIDLRHICLFYIGHM